MTREVAPAEVHLAEEPGCGRQVPTCVAESQGGAQQQSAGEHLGGGRGVAGALGAAEPEVALCRVLVAPDARCKAFDNCRLTERTFLLLHAD